jgi:hypothetical protein
LENENKLLKELLGLLVKYDYDEIEYCLNYLVKNKKQLNDWILFAEGKAVNAGGPNKKKNHIDEILLNTDREKKTVIKRIIKILSSNHYDTMTIVSSFMEFLEMKQYPSQVNFGDNKESILSEIGRSLANLSREDIIEFERSIQMKTINVNENNLENWSKIIVKDN